MIELSIQTVVLNTAAVSFVFGVIVGIWISE